MTNVIEDSPERSLLRYHGGKWMLAPWIIGHFPQHRVYVEPFGGGASVLLRKPRAAGEVYNDLDGEIVNLFRVVRDHAPDLRRRVELTPFARTEFDLSYETAVGDPVEQARRTLVRAQMGFGGTLTRPNRDGSPQRTGFRLTSVRTNSNGALTWSTAGEHIEAIAMRLRGVTIENSDAMELIPKMDSSDTLFFIDPPYVHDTRTPAAGGTHRGYRYEMLDGDHGDLAKLLRRVAGKVVLSGYDCPLYKKLYRGWFRVDREAHAAGGRDRTESLWLNSRAAAEFNAGSLFPSD